MVTLTSSARLDDRATGTQTGTINEPTVGCSSNALLVAGNWYASWSPDFGSTWQALDPFTQFPATAAGFCCDQVVTYVPSARLWIWFLQYSEDAGGENIIRLAVSRTGGRGPWRWWDVRPTDLSSSWRGTWFDYPDLQVSGKHLWLSLNLFAGERWQRSVVLRYPLAELSRAQPATRRHWSTTTVGSLRFVAGAQDAMWFAGTLVGRSALKLFRWDEDEESVQGWDVPVSPWSADWDDYSSRCPDGTPWLNRVDDRITGAWRAGGRLGFVWSAGRSASRPHPFVRTVVVDEASTTLLAEPDLWSESAAWAYPTTAPNRRGEVGLAAFYGGPSSYPAFAVGVWDEVQGSWQTKLADVSTHSPPDRSWGDYVTIRPHVRRPTSWVAAGYTLQGGRDRRHIEPVVVTFRR